MSRRTRRRSALTLVILGLTLSGLAGCSDWPAVEGNATIALRTSSSPPRPSPPATSAPVPSQTEPGTISVETDIVYREVDGQQVMLDVCQLPGADSPRAAVLLVHGGAFAAGDKSTARWQEICRWLAESGYVAVNLNYRLAPEHRFPAAIEDLQAAVQWTRANSQTYGIDPARIGVIGGSAGANLAQLLGTSGDGSVAQGSRVASVVSLSGAADFTERALTLGEPQSIQIQRVLDYLGCAELVGCPTGAAASPITQVDPTDPPFLLAQSENESLPVEQTEVMAEALTAAGASPEVLIRPGRAHATRLLDDPPVADAVLAFLARTLG